MRSQKRSAPERGHPGDLTYSVIIGTSLVQILSNQILIVYHQLPILCNPFILRIENSMGTLQELLTVNLA